MNYLRTRSIPLVLAVLLLAGCARAVAIESDAPGSAYTVFVTNSTSSTLDVSFNDGGDDRALGSVGAGRTERFIVASPRRTDITIAGATSSGTRLSGPVRVTLTAGAGARVTLR
jgi:hypothetical protein